LNDIRLNGRYNRAVSDAPPITLRRFISGDAERVHAMLGSGGQAMLEPSTLQSAKSWIANFPYDRFAVVNECAEIVGEIHFVVSDDKNSAEMGYMTAKEFEGRGIATAAVEQMVDYGFRILKLRRIWARTGLHKTDSQRVLEKAGFAREATSAECTLSDGTRAAMAVFSKFAPG
jgi:RimJ/RimL family protein N-acetyltransferase